MSLTLFRTQRAGSHSQGDAIDAPRSAHRDAAMLLAVLSEWVRCGCLLTDWKWQDLVLCDASRRFIWSLAYEHLTRCAACSRSGADAGARTAGGLCVRGGAATNGATAEGSSRSDRLRWRTASVRAAGRATELARCGCGRRHTWAAPRPVDARTVACAVRRWMHRSARGALRGARRGGQASALGRARGAGGDHTRAHRRRTPDAALQRDDTGGAACCGGGPRESPDGGRHAAR